MRFHSLALFREQHSSENERLKAPWLEDYVKTAQFPNIWWVFAEKCVLMRTHQDQPCHRRQTTPSDPQHQHCQTGGKKSRRSPTPTFHCAKLVILLSCRYSKKHFLCQIEQLYQLFTSAVVSVVAMATQSTHPRQVEEVQPSEKSAEGDAHSQGWSWGKLQRRTGLVRLSL